jgi:hypothetical protein
MTGALSDPLETARLWRLNSMAALKMMIWRHESQAQDPEEYAAILNRKAELAQLQARENAIKTRHTRMYGQKHLTP